MNVLVLNCGSSSAKFAVIDSSNGAGADLRHRPAARLGARDPRLEGRRAEAVARSSTTPTTARALREVGEILAELGLAETIGAWVTAWSTAAPASPGRSR